MSSCGLCGPSKPETKASVCCPEVAPAPLFLPWWEHLEVLAPTRVWCLRTRISLQWNKPTLFHCCSKPVQRRVKDDRVGLLGDGTGLSNMAPF